MHARLRPGAHLLRRRDDCWQVGLDPTRRLLVPGTGATPPSLAGRLPGGAVFRAALPSPQHCAPPVLRTVAALVREAGDASLGILDRRATYVVQVETFGAAGSGSLGDELVDVCARTGLRLAAPGARVPAAPVVALVGVGEPSRATLDPHVRAHVPHLLVRLTEGRAIVGPFVEPGRTPCLRCLDAHLTDADLSWPLLVEQYARAVTQERADGVPEPVDAALATVAVAWAARDLATYAEGGTPTTLATTVELGPRLETVATRHWSPHPRCGCSWR